MIMTSPKGRIFVRCLFAVLLFSAVSFAQVTATTKVLKDACRVAIRESATPGPWSSAESARNFGYCMGTVTMWMDMADGYLLDNSPEPMEVFTVTSDVKVRELIQEFIEVSDKHPELDEKGAI